MSGDEAAECDSSGGGCAEALEQLQAFLDGELPDTDVGEIEEHLNACYPCTERATFEEQLRAIVRRECVDEAPPALLERIRAHLGGAAAS